MFTEKNNLLNCPHNVENILSIKDCQLNIAVAILVHMESTLAANKQRNYTQVNKKHL